MAQVGITEAEISKFGIRIAKYGFMHFYGMMECGGKELWSEVQWLCAKRFTICTTGGEGEDGTT
jgi:hypothetical protein